MLRVEQGYNFEQGGEAVKAIIESMHPSTLDPGRLLLFNLGCHRARHDVPCIVYSDDLGSWLGNV